MDLVRLVVAVALVLCVVFRRHSADAENRHVFLEWEVSYSVRSPLGVAKKVIAINGNFPGPLLNLTTNDVAHVNVLNTLDEPFLLTWNGLQMRRNSWNDGVAGTNCAIRPGENWTYVFQVKDEVGSFFYRPSLGLHATAGGHGPIRVNNRPVIDVPFPQPDSDLDVLVGDWYNMDVSEMRQRYLDKGRELPSPDGILIDGLGPYEASLTFKAGRTYRLRVSNVGTRTSLSFRIQGHKLLLVEAEGTYTAQKHYASLDVHPGQSLSVLVAADQAPKPYYMVVSSLFVSPELFGVATVLYAGGPSANANGDAPLHDLSSHNNYNRSMEQAKTIRMNLTSGAARPNPQGSFHYASINVTRTVLLQNGVADIDGRRRCTVNGVAFANTGTPLKLADYFRVTGVFTVVSGRRERRKHPALGTTAIDASYKDFVQIVFDNRLPSLQTWHLDGYSFFVAGMGWGKWSPDTRSTYNLVDAVYRSTVQVYPASWTAVLVYLDNEGMWNLRSQDLEKKYLGQEVYLRVSQGNSEVPDPRDELPMPSNALLCGKATGLRSWYRLGPGPA